MFRAVQRSCRWVSLSLVYDRPTGLSTVHSPEPTRVPRPHALGRGKRCCPGRPQGANTEHSDRGGYHWFTIAYSIRQIPAGCEPESAVAGDDEGGAAGEDAEDDQMGDAMCDAPDEWEEEEMRMADAMLDGMDW